MDHDTIERLAKLAALGLTETEIDQADGDLTRMIALIDEMQSVNTNGIEPLAHPLDASQALRPDAVTEQVDRAKNQASAPETGSGLYLVPRVVE